jgi:hypothetical protein
LLTIAAAWHILFLSLWKDFEGRFSRIINALKEQRDFVDREAASIDIAESKDVRSRLLEAIRRGEEESKQRFELEEKNARIMQLQHSMTWLSIDDEVQETEYDRISQRRHKGTCGWILEEPQMRAWITQDTKYPVLWLSGKPGSGT